MRATATKRRNSGAGPQLAAAACLLCLACGSQTQTGSGSGGTGATGTGGAATGSGGTTASGGATGSGGATSTGGATGTGGVTAGTGGAAGSAGGLAGAGGTKGSGGATGTGGAPTGTGGAAGSGSSGKGGSSGGATGSASATGSGGSGGAAANPVTPTQVSGTSTYSFTSGDLILQIDGKTGARVSKLSLSGADMIITTASDPTTWGSVFWTTPRSAWTPVTWPPPAAIDNDPYTMMISGTHLTAAGMTDPSMGFAMLKDYAVDATSGWITINYTIDSTKAQKAGPWEVSRVPRGGIAFFPLGSSVTPGPLTITQSGGIVWFNDASMSATSPDGSKLIADGADGWEAYAFGGNLFLKKYVDQPASAEAPGEGEVDIYPGATWLEFEVEGAYTSIAANGSLPWKMQWKLVKIPSSVTVAVGSASLLTFAQQQAAM
jgi:hypothetical protein